MRDVYRVWVMLMRDRHDWIYMQQNRADFVLQAEEFLRDDIKGSPL